LPIIKESTVIDEYTAFVAMGDARLESRSSPCVTELGFQPILQYYYGHPMSFISTLIMQYPDDYKYLYEHAKEHYFDSIKKIVDQKGIFKESSKTFYPIKIQHGGDQKYQCAVMCHQSPISNNCCHVCKLKRNMIGQIYLNPCPIENIQSYKELKSIEWQQQCVASLYNSP
jgi:hypothetical protein